MRVLPNGQIDAGVMCRDAALLTAMLTERAGIACEICEGQAAIFAPLRDGRPGWLQFRTHAWIEIPGFGVCDLSPDIKPGGGPGWGAHVGGDLIGSRYHPGGGGFDYIIGDARQFDRCCAQHVAAPPDFGSVYLEERRQPFDTVLFVGAVNFAQSMLSKELQEIPGFSLDILAKAGLHLWLFYKGRVPSLTHLSPRESWATIAGIDSRKAEDFRLRLRLPDLATRAA